MAESVITNRTLKISDKFASQCAPVIDSNYPTTGTITKSSIEYLNKTQIGELYAPGGLFADLDAWFKHSIEMRACGMQRYGLYDWVMANADRSQFRGAVSGVRGVKIASKVMPFIKGRQESVVNRDYWKVVAAGKLSSGWTFGATPAAVTTATTGIAEADLNPTAIKKEDGTTSYAKADLYLIRLENRHNIPLDANWFRTRENLHVFTRAADGTSEHGTWRVSASYVTSLDDGTKVLDVIVINGNFPAANTAFLSPAEGCAAAAGVVVPGVNNVNGYEKWCQDLPTIDPRKEVPFWIQTWRTGRRVDGEYREVWQHLFDTNPAFREFGDLPLAEKNKQDEQEMQKRFVNDLFFNKPISDNQNLTDWESLEPIYTVLPTGTNTFGKLLSDGANTVGKLQGRRANFIGWKEQLRQCDRVFDLGSQQFDFYEWLDQCYLLARYRKTTKGSCKALDFYTNSIFAGYLDSAFVNYRQIETGGNPDVVVGGVAMGMTNSPLRVTIEAGKVNEMGMNYSTYRVKRPAGVDINIITDEYFDDLRDEFADSSIEGRGNFLLGLDIGKPGGGTMYYAQIAAARKVYKSAKIEELAKYDSTFRCVMEKDDEEQTLVSETGTAVVECPLCSIWIENFHDKINMTRGANTTTSGGSRPSGIMGYEPDMKGGLYAGGYLS